MTYTPSREQLAHEHAEYLVDKAIDEAAERQFLEDEAREEWLAQNPDEVPYWRGEEDAPRSENERQADRLAERSDEWRPLDYERPVL